MIEVKKKNIGTPGYSKNASWIVDYFTGDDVFIVGGGPSLIGFEVKKLDKKRVIAINHSYRFVKHEILVFLDAQFKTEIKNNFGHSIEDMDCRIIAGPSAAVRESERITVIQFAEKPSQLPDRMYGRMCSTLIAINAALIGDAKRIFLLGIDGKFEGGKDHFYSDMVHSRNDREQSYRRMNSYFEPYAKFKNIYNCSPVSIVPYFQKINIDDVI